MVIRGMCIIAVPTLGGLGNGFCDVNKATGRFHCFFLLSVHGTLKERGLYGGNTGVSRICNRIYDQGIKEQCLKNKEDKASDSCSEILLTCRLWWLVRDSCATLEYGQV